jgi:thiol:disulfide interchange protein DsbG
MYRFIFMFLIAGILIFPPLEASAQEREPALPKPLATMQQQGAQIRYLGRSLGMDGWITIKSGQEQYFYAPPNGKALIMGLMFDDTGKAITLRQINELREKEGDVLDLFSMNPASEQISQRDILKNPTGTYKTPAEQLFSDIESSNWVTLGNKDAPVIYTFIDPQCPHCKDFIKDMRSNYLPNGLVQVRMIPVGFRDETRAQAAFLLAAADPERSLYRHLDGDSTALPTAKTINQQGVQQNLSIMQSWQFNVTPLTIYRSTDGEVKIVQGRVKSPSSLVADLQKSME